MGVSLRETIFEMVNAERTEPAYSRTFNLLLKNRLYPRHGMRVRSNDRNSSRSFELVGRETMENRESKNVCSNKSSRSFEIISLRESARYIAADRDRIRISRCDGLSLHQNI